MELQSKEDMASRTQRSLAATAYSYYLFLFTESVCVKCGAFVVYYKRERLLLFVKKILLLLITIICTFVSCESWTRNGKRCCQALVKKMYKNEKCIKLFYPTFLLQ